MNPTRRLEVSIDEQTLKLIEGDECIRRFDISTAIKGMGFTKDSYRTPTGRFRIVEKIGAGEASGTIFKQRTACGLWQPGDPAQGDLVLSRILRIEGLDPENTNSFERFIYIHGTNHEHLLGQPASQGCVRLGNSAMIELFDMVEEGMELSILPATRLRGKLFFIDCDSTLSNIEGIDELARAKGEDVFAQVVNLTNAAMNGEVPIHEVFPRRMEMIRPDRALCDEIGALYVNTIVPGAEDLIRDLKAAGWFPVILSGGFEPIIRPLANHLGISHVEAVPLYFHEDGSYKGYGEDYPTTRNLGKNEVIREWKQAVLPERVLMMGDGVSDLETKPDVDAFVGFGGVVARVRVESGCDYWLADMNNRSVLNHIISEMESGDQSHPMEIV
jgi:HAD superfamily phosphoserine phosphatase-like hydrolase